MKPFTFEELCGAGLVLSGFACVILTIVLRLVTVRKLLRNPATRDRLGLPLYPGWQTLNVSAALSWPLCIGRWFDQRPMPIFRAHAQTLYAQTSTRDRILARACYATQVFCVACLVVGLVHRWLR